MSVLEPYTETPLIWMLKRLIFCSCFSLSLIFISSDCLAQNTAPATGSDELSNLGPGLRSLQKIYDQGGTPAVGAYVRGRRIDLENDRVEAVLELTDNLPLSRILISSMGVSVKRRYRNQILVTLPLPLVTAIARNLNGQARIRLPFYPMEDVTSDGVQIIGGNDFQSLGMTGQNVRVGIIDDGFQFLTDAQRAGELPADLITVDIPGTGIETTTDHGTAVAEIIHDMAPGAELHLLRIRNDVDLGIAKDYAIANQIQIISHSAGWFNTAFYDGTGPICDIANDASAHGILWVNSAGNAADQHYQATLTDRDNDLRHEFADQDEALGFTALFGSIIYIYVNWDAYPSTTEDYDLYLFDVDPDLNPGVFPVASSTFSQGPSPQPPAEGIIYQVPASAFYYLVISKRSAQEANLPFDVYLFGVAHLEHQSPESSLSQPADAGGVLAVGAVDLTDGLRLYSSQGPTNDGRIKPDLVAPDGVVNATYGIFAGTSASAPHVAGAAALLLSQDPSLSLQQLRNLLQGNTLDLGSIGKDNSYGFGRPSLDADGDGVIHDQDNCPLASNVDQQDTDGDSAGDVCDLDDDNDGLADTDEVSLYGTDPLLSDTDGDDFSDGEEIASLTDPLDPSSFPGSGTGDIAPHGAPDGNVNTADALLALKMASGLLSPTPTELARADVAPLSNPDGVIDLSDVLLIFRKSVGLVQL